MLLDLFNRVRINLILMLQELGLQIGAELGQHPTLPLGLTSKLLKDTFARIKSFVGCALQHIRLSGPADVGK